MTGISISGGTDAGNYTLVNTTASTTANITLAPRTTDGDGHSGSRQYSDKVTFKATISPASAGPVAPATSVTFKIGSLTMGTADTGRRDGNREAGGDSLERATARSVAHVPPAGPMTPGSKTVTAVFNGKNPNFTHQRPDDSADREAGGCPLDLHRRHARFHAGRWG